VQVGTRRKELFEFWSWRKYPLKDLHWVAEHPERLSKRLLEQEARKALYSPSVGEGRRTKSLRGLSVCRSSEEKAPACA
jgi:hypothetical protein